MENLTRKGTSWISKNFKGCFPYSFRGDVFIIKFIIVIIFLAAFKLSLGFIPFQFVLLIIFQPPGPSSSFFQLISFCHYSRQFRRNMRNIILSILDNFYRCMSVEHFTERMSKYFKGFIRTFCWKNFVKFSSPLSFL